MIPIIIPGSVVRAAGDGLKSLDDKVTGGAVQSKTTEAKKSAAATAEKKKKEAEDSEAGKAVAAKAKEASLAIDEGLGRFSKWRAEKAAELEAWVDEVRGAQVVAAPGEQPPQFPPEQLYYPDSTNLRFQLMLLPAGLSPGDRIATPTGEPFEPPRDAAVGCTLKVPVPNPAGGALPTASATAASATAGSPPAYTAVDAAASAGQPLEAPCRKQHPVMGAWLERHARIEGKSLNFYDKPNDDKPPSSAVEDVTGCGFRLGGRSKKSSFCSQFLIEFKHGHTLPRQARDEKHSRENLEEGKTVLNSQGGRSLRSMATSSSSRWSAVATRVASQTWRMRGCSNSASNSRRTAAVSSPRSSCSAATLSSRWLLPYPWLLLRLRLPVRQQWRRHHHLLRYIILKPIIFTKAGSGQT